MLGLGQTLGCANVHPRAVVHAAAHLALRDGLAQQRRQGRNLALWIAWGKTAPWGFKQPAVEHAKGGVGVARPAGFVAEQALWP